MTIDELRILRGLSMTKLCEAAGLSMGAVFKLTRPGAELERARPGHRYEAGRRAGRGDYR